MLTQAFTLIKVIDIFTFWRQHRWLHVLVRPLTLAPLTRQEKFMQKKASGLSGKEQLHECADLHLSLVLPSSPMKSSKGSHSGDFCINPYSGSSTLTLEVHGQVGKHQRFQGQLQWQAPIQTMLEATR